MYVLVVVSHTCPPFASHLNFLDQQFDSKGNPYGPIRYKQLVRECYEISRIMNTPYTDVLNISPLEREYLREFIKEDNERSNKMLEEKMAQIKQK